MTARSRISTLLPILAVVLGLVIPAGSARAAFELPAFDVAAEGTNGMPSVATDVSGAAHYAWYKNGAGVLTRTRAADGSLGPVRAISSLGADLGVAVDGVGNRHYSWRSTDGAGYIARTRRLGADGTLGPIQDLSSAGFNAMNVRVATDPYGRATFAWMRTIPGGTIIQARRREFDGSFGEVKSISVAGDVHGPELAVDDSSNAVLAWTTMKDGSYIVQARRWAANGTLGEIKDLSEPGHHAYETSLAVDPAGTAHVAFVRNEELIMRSIAPDGTVTPAEDLGRQPEDDPHEPSVAAARNGDAQLVWAENADVGFDVLTRRRFADGSYGPVTAIGTAIGVDVTTQLVAFGANGDTHYVWRGKVGERIRIQARALAADGSLGPVEDLSGPGSGFGGNTDQLALAAGPVGGPVAAWRQERDNPDADGWAVQSAVVPAPPPAGGSGGDDGDGASGGGTGAGGVGGLPVPDLVAPTLSRATLKPARIPPRGRARLVYSLSEAAKVELRVVRLARAARRLGTIRATGASGRNTLAFRPRLRGRRLRPGRYLLRVRATDPTGNRSATTRLRFRVLGSAG